MVLRDLWLSSPEQLRTKQVQQIIAFAGEGKLLDRGTTSSEFREFLGHVPSEFLKRYATECLTDSFPNSGHALQDVVNEVGRRLGFVVTHGRYRGVSGQIGFDGLWTFPTGHAAVVEVKTTDAYRIDLNVVAIYRRSLIEAGQMKEPESSILIIVGRQDTGDLEAQIRGLKTCLGYTRNFARGASSASFAEGRARGSRDDNSYPQYSYTARIHATRRNCRPRIFSR